MSRRVSLYSLILGMTVMAVVLVYFLDGQSVTYPSSMIWFTIPRESEGELVTTLHKFADDEEFELRGNKTIYHEKSNSEEWLNMGLYSGSGMLILIGGEYPLGHYHVFIYPHGDGHWREAWNGLLATIRKQFGNNVSFITKNGAS